MRRVGFREMTWRPFLPNGRPGEAVVFEVEEDEYEYLAGLQTRIENAAPGKSRSVLIAELRTLLDLHGHFPGSELSEPPAQTDVLAEVADAEANGFAIPPSFRAHLEVGQLRMDEPGALKPEALTDPDRELTDPDRNEIGKFQAPGRGAAVTQRKAAILVYPRTGTQRRKVLDYVAAEGERGATDEEIAAALGMLANTERPRRVELEEGGWIADSGLRRKTAASGSDAAVWTLTEEGRMHWTAAASA